MADVTFKFEGSLGFEGNKSSHRDGSNRVWAFAFGHTMKSGWDSGRIEVLNDVYSMVRGGYAMSRGLLVSIPRNGGGEIPIVDFNLDLFGVKGKLRPTSFNIHVYKYEDGQFPASRKIAFNNVSRLSVKSTVFEPFWINNVPIGFGSSDASYDVHHFTYGDYEIF